MASEISKVFLSYTSDLARNPPDLSFVAAAQRAVITARMLPVHMEIFSASESPPANYCVDQVTGCDLYVGLIGHRYGTPVRDRPELSYVELEFDTATRSTLPRLIFTLDEDAGNDPVEPRQRRFRQQIRRDSGLVCANFGTPDQLERLVYQALMEIRERRKVPFGAPALPPSFVPRPDLGESLARLLDWTGSEADQAPRALVGTGGFGKTSLAVEACHRLRASGRFSGGVLWASIGENCTGEELAEKINVMSDALTGHKPGISDPEQAGQHLAAALASPALVVLDDVWTTEQLRAFDPLRGRGLILVTTRNRSALPSGVRTLTVDLMSSDEATQVLLGGLPSLTGPIVGRLLAISGFWPVLLSLINGSLRRAVRRGLPLPESATRVEEMLLARGPGALDLTRERDRRLVVKRTLDVSLSFLGAGGRPDHVQRYLELAAFPDNTDIPQDVLARLWERTGGLSSAETTELMLDLADLSMVQGFHASPLRIRIHDVIRAYLRHEVGAEALKAENATLLAAFRTALPSTERGETAWWSLPREAGYLWRTLGYHLVAAGAEAEWEQLVLRPDWITAKLERVGPVALSADLAASGHPDARRLRRLIKQSEHLLGELQPEYSLTATLLSRLPPDAPGNDLAGTMAATIEGRFLEPVWPLPDAPSSHLRSVLKGSKTYGSIESLAGDNRYLTVVGSESITVWDMDEGVALEEIKYDRKYVREETICHGRRFLVVPGETETIIWDISLHRIHRTHVTPSNASAFAVDQQGRWLATGTEDGTVILIDLSTLHEIGLPAFHTDEITNCLFTPDGASLMTLDSDGVLAFWDTGLRLLRHADRSRTIEDFVALPPQGGWVAVQRRTSDADPFGLLFLDTRDGRAIGKLKASRIRWGSCSISPDGTRLATAGDRWRGEIVIWDTTDPADICEVRSLNLHEDMVTLTVFSPDGDQLLTGDQGGESFLTELTGAGRSVPLSGHSRPVVAGTFAADGSWIASSAFSKPDCRVFDDPFRRLPAQETMSEETVDEVTAFRRGLRHRMNAAEGIQLWSPTSWDNPPKIAGRKNEVEDFAAGRIHAWLMTSERFTGIWSLDDGHAVRALPCDSFDHFATFERPDGAYLAAIGEGPDGDDWCSLWNLVTGTQLHRFPFRADPFHRFPSPEEYFTVSPDITVVAAGIDGDLPWIAMSSERGVISLWDFRDGRRMFSSPSGFVHSYRFEHDVGPFPVQGGAALAALDSIGVIQVFAARDGRIQSALRAPDGLTITSFATDLRGDKIAGVDSSGALRLWSAADGRLISWTGTGLTDAEILRVGDRTITAHTREEIITWEFGTGLLTRIPVQRHSRAAVNADGRLLCTVSERQEVRILHLPNGECITALRLETDINGCCWIGPLNEVCLVGLAGAAVLRLTDGSVREAFGSGPEPERIPTVLADIALSHSRSHYRNKAPDYALLSAKHWRRFRRWTDYAAAMNAAGLCYEILKDREAGIRCFEESLDVFEVQGAFGIRTAVLTNLARSARGQGDFRRSTTFARYAVGSCLSPASPEFGEAHRELAWSQKESGDPTAAMATLRSSAEFLVGLGRTSEELNHRWLILALGKERPGLLAPPDLLAELGRTLDLVELLGSDRDVAMVALDLGTAQFQAGNLLAAAVAFQSHIRWRSGSSENEADSQLRDIMRDHTPEIIAYHRARGDLDSVARTHKDHANLLSRNKRYAEAVEAYGLGIETFRSLGADGEVSLCLGERGRVLRLCGRFAEARTDLLASAAYDREHDDGEGERWTLRELGLACEGLGLFAEAAAHYERRVAVCDALNDGVSTLQSRWLAGHALCEEAEWTKAVEILTCAVETEFDDAAGTTPHWHLGRAFMNLARARGALEEPGPADEALAAAARHFSLAEDREQYRDALVDLIAGASEQEHWQDVLDRVERLLDPDDQAPDSYRAWALRRAAWAHSRLDDWLSAANRYLEAADLNESRGERLQALDDLRNAGPCFRKARRFRPMMALIRRTTAMINAEPDPEIRDQLLKAARKIQR